MDGAFDIIDIDVEDANAPPELSGQTAWQSLIAFYEAWSVAGAEQPRLKYTPWDFLRINDNRDDRDLDTATAMGIAALPPGDATDFFVATAGGSPIMYALLNCGVRTATAVCVRGAFCRPFEYVGAMTALALAPIPMMAALIPKLRDLGCGSDLCYHVNTRVNAVDGGTACTCAVASAPSTC